ncbi:MAG: fused MFS/spermidine synthase [Oscillatoriales cyanobacterium RU_3_3]|nr:fused MFS/spermidine synthase [Microcoleus sp. SU_5_6]NJM63365.1 fused MFS/spermidine synthase [Oscillatoriales cyanobacterium RU_3_3]
MASPTTRRHPISRNFRRQLHSSQKNQIRTVAVLADRSTLTTNVAQSIFDLNNPLNFIFPYAKAIVLALIWQSQPKNIYIIGFGGGSIPQFFHHYFPDATIECTDIDRTIVAVAQKYFGIQLDDRLKVAIQDGRDYLAEKISATKYDIIIVDAGFGSGYMPYRLVTQEFYQLCKSRLSNSGVIAVHLFHKQDFNAAAVKTLQSVFARVYTCNLAEGNSIAIATNLPLLDKNEIFFKAEIIQDFHNLEFSLTEQTQQLKNAAQLLESVANWEALPMFTDAAMPPGYLD